MFKFRSSKRPSKQLLWLIVLRYLSKNRYNNIIDIASATFILYHSINSKNYSALDIEKSSIDYIKKKYPNVETYNTSLEDFHSPKKWDLVLCLQTIGINHLYNNKNTIKNIIKLHNITDKNGDLIFNIGPESIFYKKEINEFLLNKYNDLKKIEYGTFSFETNAYLSLILGLLMYFIPVLRNIRNNYCLYICKNKK